VVSEPRWSWLTLTYPGLVGALLFFFLSLEKQEICGLTGVGTDAISSGRLNQAQVDAVANAFSTSGLDPGPDVAAGLDDPRPGARPASQRAREPCLCPGKHGRARAE